MERQSRVHLDHPTIRGRIRSPRVQHASTPRHVDPNVRSMRAPGTPTPTSKQIVSLPPSKPTSQHPASLPHQPTVLKIRTAPIAHATLHTSAHLPRQTRSGVLRRQMVKASAKKYRPKKHYSYKPYLFAGLAVFALLLSGSVGALAYKKMRNNSAVTGVLAKQTLTGTETKADGTSGSELPSEDNPPVDIRSYVVAPNMPRFLKIGKIGLDARIRRVGPDENGGIKGPTNIYDVGWYENSSPPGENGTIVLDGHVAGQSNRGVFYGLSTLKKNDIITLERGDGKQLTYTVVSIEQADFENLDKEKVLNSAVPNKPGLNLMTASGRFNVRTNQYEKRVIVYAVQD